MILLAASSKRAPPQVRDVVAERSQGPAIGRHGMVGEEAGNDLPQPLPLLGDRLVPSPPHLLLDLPELGSHAVTPGLPFDQEVAPTALAADEGKAQEVEGLRFSEPAPGALCRRVAAELDQAGLVRMERQRELLQPRTHRVPEAVGVGLAFETDDAVIGKTHDDHVAHGLTPSPAL